MMCNSKCVLFILIMLTSNSFCACQMINEINFHTKTDAFIELYLPSCNSSCTENLRLIILEEQNSEPNSYLTLSDVIILDNIITNEYGLYTIGQGNRSHHLQRDLKYNSSYLQGLALISYKNVSQIDSARLDQMLVANLRNSDYSESPTHWNQHIPTLVGIKNALVDFIVHGIGGPHKNCGAFKYFDPTKRVLIEFNDEDYSLSQCTPKEERRSFYPNGFELTLPTPGAPNSCIKPKLVNEAFYLFECDGSTLEVPRTARGVPGAQKCKVFINELNTGVPTQLSNQDFIELFAYCEKPTDYNSLQGYKLIGISTGSEETGRMVIDLVVNLWNSKWNNDMFFTIGTPNVQKVDLTTETNFVLYLSKFRGNNKFKNNFMSPGPGKKHLHAIALLYKESYNFPDIALTLAKPFVIIDTKIKNLIRDNLVDMVVYGRKAPYDNCVLFTDLYDDFTNRDYIIREFDNENLDRTLNRCATDFHRAFVPDRFKIGLPTPGETNDCTGPHFCLEQYLDDLSDSLQQQPFDSDNLDAIDNSLMESDSAQCTSSIEPSVYASTSEEAINAEITMQTARSQTDSCTAINLGADDGNIGEELDVLNRRKRALCTTNINEEEFEWETEKYFDDNWLESIRANQKNIPPMTVAKNKVWFEYLPNELEPANSRYRCRLCYKYFDKMGLQESSKPALASEIGQLHETYKKNQEFIGGHSKTATHLNIISQLKSQKAKRLRRDIQEDETKEELANNNNLLITARIFRTVFVVNKLSLPFNDHAKLVSLQRLNGLDMGYHHYERTSCIRISMFLSGEMHTTLVDFLMKEQMPISIIIDDTTDLSKVHYMIVYFQTIENGRPVIYFYKLIEMKAETGRAHFEALKSAWDSEKPGFSEYMKNNLVGFASDGAPVNLGENDGIIAHLRRWASNQLFAVHCMAHRLELVVLHALDEDEDRITNNIENTINSVYSFYSGSHKKKTHLKQTAEERGRRFYELKKIIPIRWVASDYMAMKTLLKMWDVFIIDLRDIMLDENFDDKSRHTAQTLRTNLQGKYFLMILNILFDIVSEVAVYSLKMQKRSALLVDSSSFRLKFIGEFDKMRTEHGKNVNFLLQEAKCLIDDEREPCKTLENYINNNDILFKSVRLSNDEEDFPDMVHFKATIVDSILKEFRSYFPDGDLTYFDVLNPESMPEDEVDALLYGQYKISKLNEHFKITSQNNIVQQWNDLLESIVVHDRYCELRTEKTSVSAFWSQIFKWPEIVWNAEIKRLIQIILSIPISSAEAERGFSTLKYLRDAHRSRLTPEHLDAMLRIKLNGPDELDHFAAAKYADKWINAGNLASDNPMFKKGEDVITYNLIEEEDVDMKKKYLLKSTIF